MRKRLTLLILAIGGVVLTGSPVFAGTPATHLTIPDETFVDVNPCTGAPIEITVHYDDAVFRESTGTGGVHVVFAGHGSYTTDTGLSGPFRGTVMFQVSASGAATHTYTFSNTLQTDDGLILVMLSGHLTIENDTPSASFDRASFECVAASA